MLEAQQHAGDAPAKARSTRFMDAFNRGYIWVVLFGAIAVGAVSTTSGVTSLVSSVSTGEVSLTLLADAPLPEEASAGTAELVSGSFETARVTLANVEPLTSALLMLGSVVGILTTLIASMAVAYLCWKVLRRRAFDRSVSWMAYAVGSVLLIGTIAGLGFGGLGRMMAASELNADGGSRFWPLMTSLDFTPGFVGLAILVLALAFEAGSSMQRDTEGLI